MSTSKRRPRCRVVDVDGEPIRVRGVGELTARDVEAFAEVVRAVRRRLEDDPAYAEELGRRQQAALERIRARAPWRTGEMR